MLCLNITLHSSMLWVFYEKRRFTPIRCPNVRGRISRMHCYQSSISKTLQNRLERSGTALISILAVVENAVLSASARKTLANYSNTLKHH